MKKSKSKPKGRVSTVQDTAEPSICIAAKMLGVARADVPEDVEKALRGIDVFMGRSGGQLASRQTIALLLWTLQYSKSSVPVHPEEVAPPTNYFDRNPEPELLPGTSVVDLTEFKPCPASVTFKQVAAECFDKVFDTETPLFFVHRGIRVSMVPEPVEVLPKPAIKTGKNHGPYCPRWRKLTDPSGRTEKVYCGQQKDHTGDCDFVRAI